MQYRLILLTLMLTSLSLSACGKKGAPVAPNGSDGSCYPGSYPSNE